MESMQHPSDVSIPLDCRTQERTDIQQQHLVAFAAGSLDVPELQGGSKRAALLRDAQTFLTTTAQVPCTVYTRSRPRV